MSNSITLPRLIGSQEAAASLVSQSGIKPDLTNQKVRLLGRNISTSTQVFADSLLKILTHRNVEEVILIGCPRDFTEFMNKAADSLGFDAVRVGSSEDLEELIISLPSFDVNHALRDLAREMAYEQWDRSHGFGLYHVSAQAQESEFASARKKVDKWFAKLEPVVAERDRNLLLKKLENAEEHIGDKWGESGLAALTYLKSVL